MAKAAAMRNLPVMARVNTTQTCVSMEELRDRGKSRPCIKMHRGSMNYIRQFKKRCILKLLAKKYVAILFEVPHPSLILLFFGVQAFS
jgi:hypothetical protein